jgi:heme exporter protein A
VSFTPFTTPHLLCTSDLACERDLRVLYSGLSLSVKAGELWHVKGCNGAGKTTLLRQLAGLHPVDIGKVLYPQTSIKIIYIGHKLGLKEQLTSTQLQRYAALERAGLKGYEENTVAQLSAGQKRRVALARLHLCKADVWLLDEPFTSLDHQGIEDEQDWLNQHTLAGGAVLMTSHQEVSLPQVNILDLSQYAGLSSSSPSSGGGSST